jgi:hypothetical protein
MPSRAEMRVRVEQVLRAIVIAALALMLWQSLQEESDSVSKSISARGAGVGSALAEWSSMSKPPRGIHAELDNTPSPLERAWLGALSGAGSRVTWSGAISPVMIEAEPVASPAGGTRILLAAPSGSSIAISDDVGPIDTLQAQHMGGSLGLSSTAGRVTARSKGSVASTLRRDSLTIRKVLVIGDAGWESKFVVAALEEEGWKVDAFIRVAPGVDVTQGAAVAIDTSRYSAVIALDGAVSPYANRIVEFARRGGGVVLTPEAATLDVMAPLRVGVAGRASADAGGVQTAGSVTLTTLPLAPITSLRSDGVALEQRAGTVAAAARRVGAGRALQVGYEDTWRWRMAGGEGAVRDHRLWWTELVSSVAYAPRLPQSESKVATDEAPMIGLVAALGPATRSESTAMLSGPSSDSMAWLFALLALGLLGEVTSRRLRGAS